MCKVCHRHSHGKDQYLRSTEIGKDFSTLVKLKMAKISFGSSTSIYKWLTLSASSSNCSFLSMDPSSLRLLPYRDLQGNKPIPSPLAVCNEHTRVQWCSGSWCYSMECAHPTWSHLSVYASAISLVSICSSFTQLFHVPASQGPKPDNDLAHPHTLLCLVYLVLCFWVPILKTGFTVCNWAMTSWLPKMTGKRKHVPIGV